MTISKHMKYVWASKCTIVQLVNGSKMMFSRRIRVFRSKRALNFSAYILLRIRLFHSRKISKYCLDRSGNYQEIPSEVRKKIFGPEIQTPRLADFGRHFWRFCPFFTFFHYLGNFLIFQEKSYISAVC